ncbi:MAG: hypothetical protein AB7P52_11610 [Alphaproteobacteria bacterium]
MTTLDSREAGLLRPTALPVTFLRIAAVNLGGLGLLFWAWMAGDIQHIYEHDVSRISLLMIGVFAVAIALVIRAAWLGRPVSDYKFLASGLVLLGLIGTILGFIRALTVITPDAAADANNTRHLVEQLITGMGVSLNTSLVGAVLGLWVLMCIWLVQMSRTSARRGDANQAPGRLAMAPRAGEAPADYR